MPNVKPVLKVHHGHLFVVLDLLRGARCANSARSLAHAIPKGKLEETLVLLVVKQIIFTIGDEAVARFELHFRLHGFLVVESTKEFGVGLVVFGLLLLFGFIGVCFIFRRGSRILALLTKLTNSFEDLLNVLTQVAHGIIASNDQIIDRVAPDTGNLCK